MAAVAAAEITIAVLTVEETEIVAEKDPYGRCLIGNRMIAAVRKKGILIMTMTAAVKVMKEKGSAATCREWYRLHGRNIRAFPTGRIKTRMIVNHKKIG